MLKQQGWLYCQAKMIQTLWRASLGVNWSWSQFIKSHHAQTSSGKGLPSHFWTRDNIRSFLPGLRRKRTGLSSKVLFSDESKCCISFGNQGPRVWRKSGETQNPCCLKSSVKFSQSVMVWAAMSSAGVGPLCFLKSTVNAAIYQDILVHFMLPSAVTLYGDADFIFQQDLAPAHTAKSWFNDHGVTGFDWPANSSDQNPIENLRSGNCGGHLSKVNSLSCSRNQSEMIWALWYCAISCWKYIRRWVHCSHKGMDMVSNNTQVGCGV